LFELLDGREPPPPARVQTLYTFKIPAGGDSDCAALALLTVAELLGKRDVSLGEIRQGLVTTPAGVDLMEVKLAVERMGHIGSALSIDNDALQTYLLRSNRYAILHTADHYVVAVAGDTAGVITVVDPGRAVFECPTAQIDKVTGWDGKALLIE
jgi:ABC-type bacteriocin/lantibiotic exporter with double-glycine peptidase domain